MEKLIKGQQELFEQLKKAERNLKKANQEMRSKCSYLTARLEALHKLEETFNQNHLDIVERATAEQVLQLPYFKDDLQDNFQELFLNYKALLNEYIEQTNPTCISPKVSASENATNKVNNSEVKLPRIVLPKFSGKYTEWQSFFDMFVSLIHENTTLSPVQKLHYLKSNLSGEPEMLLSNFPTTAANYSEAWEQLTRRYNNKRYNCNAIMKTLFGQKTLQNESASAIKLLLDTTTSCLKALNNLSIKTEQWDAIIIHLVVSKLDHESHRQWEKEVCVAADELPTWSQLEKFLETRFRSLEMVDSKQANSTKLLQRKNLKQEVKPKAFHAAVEEKVNTTEQKCTMCNGAHLINYCSDFKRLSVPERQNIARTKKLCFNCLAPMHPAFRCYQRPSCRRCRRNHNTALHLEKNDEKVGNTSIQNDRQPEQSTSEAVSSTNQTTIVANFSRGDLKTSSVLLATAVVRTTSSHGSYALRALLDQGSQASFVSEEIVQLLGLKRTNVNGKVSGLGDGQLSIKYAVSIEVGSRYEFGKVITVNAYVLKSLTSVLPSREVRVPDWLELKTLPLADPGFASPGKVDVLLGADVYGQILLDGIKKCSAGNIIAQNTIFGWILSGKVVQDLKDESIITLHVQVREDELLKKFWEIEDEPNIIEKKLTREEELCERKYEETTIRREDGRFIVRLPFKNTNPQCQYGQSYDIAKRKLHSLERRLGKNPTLTSEYNKVLEEYINLNHMKAIDDGQVKNTKAVYLPHHAVVREDKETTKVRVVFNASSKGINNVSLNDELLIGPKLQQDLRHLLLRWRKHPIGIVADLVKMYRQVLVHEDDANFQRILWRSNPTLPIQHYKLLTLTFGTACAPYLAIKTLQKLADLEKEKYPHAAKITIQDYYVDDLMTGCETEKEALKIYEEMCKLMKSGGFQLQKWSSNSEYFLNHIRKEELNTEQSVVIKVDNTMKVLGICWNRVTDNFEYVVNLPEPENPITKRNVLSDIARLYDPIGWIAPVVITAKVFMQKLWKAGLNWDDELPNDLMAEWLKYRYELNDIKSILIPRWLGSTKASKMELHAFSDASSVAYGAAVYLRVVDETEQVHVKLITSKTKVAPIEKEVSIPRLELCGSTLAAKLLNEVSQIMNIPRSNIYGWTDSTVVLAWLRGPVNRWATYISNRVSHILTIMDFEQWNHVSTHLNPADCASRGIKPTELKNYDLWWNGPDWLSKREINIEKITIEDTHEEERLKVVAMVNKVDHEMEWIKFSDLTRMLKVISLCRRFLKVKLPPNERKSLPKFVTIDEMNQTLQLCIRQAQEQDFSEDLLSLKTKGCVTRRSALRTLCPFLDQNGILRVGGRLSQAGGSYDEMHPIIMPAKNHLSLLIVADAHKRTLHGGPQVMMNFLRSKYWILRARAMVKRHYRSCVTCLRYSKAASTQLMGQLPEARLLPSRPFKTSGVDYAGPINIRFSPGRGAKSYKGYICLFVCMVTRAIHLEAVSDLTSKGFIAAFRRFVGRRGHCQDLFSDNATNFVGADSMLRNMFNNAKSELSEEIAELLTLESTKWHFIPPSAPNFGGIWEAGVRCAKAHLKRVVGDSTLTFEEMSTLLIQIEACLNSRPLSVLSDNPDDPLPLTPGHFLVGESLLNLTDVTYSDQNVTDLDRWKMIQKMVNSFWKRWSKEFLSNLNQRNKWCTKKPEVEIGDVVVVRDDNIPPAKWILGKVVDKHTGPDNVTRVVTIKVKGGSLKRPLSKLCILTKS